MVRSLSDVGFVVTNMVLTAASIGGVNANAPVAASDASVASEASKSNAAAAAAAAAAKAANAPGTTPEDEDTDVMDTKLKIIEILQVSLNFRVLIVSFFLFLSENLTYCFS